MKYSVYDYTRRVYDVYEGTGPGGTHAGSPPAARSIKGIGSPPEATAWRLPIGARKVGTSELPQGRIASLSGSDLLSDPTQLLMYAAIAYLAWKVIG